MDPKFKSAIYALEDGTIFKGIAWGANYTVTGEAVFNTSITGYQEIITDPSYYAQIVCMTAAHIGNSGINYDDEESNGPKIAGLVVHELSLSTSSWRSKSNLNEYLKRYSIPGISGLNTRALTKHLQMAGSMKACLSTEDITPYGAVAKARYWKGVIGVDLVKLVTTKYSYSLHLQKCTKKRPQRYLKLAALDFGAKQSIFYKLYHQAFNLYVLPASSTEKDIEKIFPDAVYLSNGPGDPSAIYYAHKTVNILLQKYTISGVCLGHQIIAYALGSSTFRLKFGHHGWNQPVKNIENSSVWITSQNHGFAAKKKDLASCGAIVTYYNLNDSTVEGMCHTYLPIFSVQYHPEAYPGPNDGDYLFKLFYSFLF